MKNSRFLSNFHNTHLFWFPVLVLLTACSSEGAIQQILGTSVQAPVFVDCRPVSPTEILFTFSDPVRVVSVNFDTALEIESIEEGSEVKVILARPPAEGKRITADILVEDSNRNSLNVIVPFRARNDRMPALVLNEIRTVYSNPRVEFIEFLTLEPGNLGAMKLFIAEHSLEKPFYEFPPVEVSAGEYVVLHLRTTDETSVDETGDDLGLSGGNEALKTARDFWFPDSKKHIHNTGAIWIMDQDDRVLDAVLFCEKNEDWNKYNTAAAAEFLGRKKAWLPSVLGPSTGGISEERWVPGPADAVKSTGTTATRTICRDESLPPAPMAVNWYVTANSSATPGAVNSTKRYMP